MQSRMTIFGIGAVNALAIGLVPCAAMAAPAQDPSDKPIRLTIATSSVSHSASGVVHDGSVYVSESDVQATLVSGLGIRTYVTSSGWDWAVSSKIKIDSHLVHANAGQSKQIRVGNTLVGSFTPLMVHGNVYVSVQSLRLALNPLGVLSGWDSGIRTWTWCQPQPTPLVAAYLKVHPSWQVSKDKLVDMDSHADSTLFVENDPGSTPDHPVTISAVSPNGRITEFQTPSYFVPAGFVSAQTLQGVLVGGITMGEDISQRIDWLRLSKGHLVRAGTFSGYYGLGYWIQDGRLRMLVGNPGPQTKEIPADDFVVKNVIYNWTNAGFVPADAFLSGGYHFEPKLQSNPDAAAAALFRILLAPGQLYSAGPVGTTQTISKVESACTAQIEAFARRYRALKLWRAPLGPSVLLGMTKVPHTQADEYQYHVSVPGFKLTLAEKKVRGIWEAVSFQVHSSLS